MGRTYFSIYVDTLPPLPSIPNEATRQKATGADDKPVDEILFNLISQGFETNRLQ